MSRHLEQARTAIRKEFDEWIRNTGALHPASSWRYEIDSLLERAVAEGVKAASEGIAVDVLVEEIEESETYWRRTPGTPYREIIWHYDVSDLSVFAVPDGKLHLAEGNAVFDHLGWAVCGIDLLRHYLKDDEIPGRWKNPCCASCWAWLQRRHQREEDAKVEQRLAEVEAEN